MSKRIIIGLTLIIGTILTPCIIHFVACLSSVICDLKNGEIPDECDVGYVAVYIAGILIGTGIVLVMTG